MIVVVGDDTMAAFLWFQMREITDVLEQWKLQAEQQKDMVGKVTCSTVTTATIINETHPYVIWDEILSWVCGFLCFETHERS